MRWRRSAGDDAGIEDRRAQGRPSGGFRFPGGRAGAGGGGILAVVIGIVVALLAGRGGDVAGFDIGPDAGIPRAPAADTPGLQAPAAEENLRQFVAFVQRDVQDAWSNIFARSGQGYQPTVVVLFRGRTNTACGTGTSQMGPFYCPGDRKVYVDLSFFEDLASRFDAPGDFAQAYVIAHEFGHHVQNLFGTFAQVSQARRQDPEDANELSVRLELQADCYAGIWAHTAYQQGLLEPGDTEEALGAAEGVGDDRIQGPNANADTFTHGTSAQRQEWFQRGFESGVVGDCDTFRSDI